MNYSKYPQFVDDFLCTQSAYVGEDIYQKRLCILDCFLYRSDGRECDIVDLYTVTRRAYLLLGIGVCRFAEYDYILRGEVFG